MKFTVDRGRWRCGGCGQRKRGMGETELRNAEGYMCCLGFVENQLGRDLLDLEHYETPGDLMSYLPTDFLQVDISKEGPARPSNSEFARRCIHINDNDYHTDESREAALIAEFYKEGHELVFVGQYGVRTDVERDKVAVDSNTAHPWGLNMTKPIEYSTLFSTGQLVATPGAIEAIEELEDGAAFLTEIVQRHARGDWGEVPAEDHAANDQSVIDGSRLLSAYTTPKGVKLWLITEAVGDDGRRSATTCLRPDEY